MPWIKCTDESSKNNKKLATNESTVNTVNKEVSGGDDDAVQSLSWAHNKRNENGNKTTRANSCP